MRLFRSRRNGAPEDDLSPEERDELKQRFDRYRTRSNQVFVLSFLIAAGLHLALFLRNPAREIEVPERDRNVATIDALEFPGAGGTLFSVMFDPPRILSPDGTFKREPPERVLLAQNIDVSQSLSSSVCEGRDSGSIASVSGQAHLRIGETGRVTRAEVRESTGDPCHDAVIAGIAGALWYRWLPNAEYPAPIELIQSMRIADGSL